jgi:hypothetical protein
VNQPHDPNHHHHYSWSFVILVGILCMTLVSIVYLCVEGLLT